MKTQAINTNNNKVKSNYSPPAFGLRNSKAAMYRAQQLKKMYAKKGVKYLLPNEIWSDKKILESVDIFGKGLDKLFTLNKLNKKSLQKVVNGLLPRKMNDKITIKDFSALKRDLLKFGVPSEEIESLTCNAMFLFSKKKNCLYLDFSKKNGDLFELSELKDAAKHEFKHALTAVTQNTTRIDSYKNNVECLEQNNSFNSIFILFEQIYNKVFRGKPLNFSKESMLKWQKMDSIDNLHKDFNAKINILTKNATNENVLDIESKVTYKKQFYNYLKHLAKDEKEAYGCEGGLKTQSAYVDFELKPLLYEEMEKFFAKKCRELK